MFVLALYHFLSLKFFCNYLPPQLHVLYYLYDDDVNYFCYCLYLMVFFINQGAFKNIIKVKVLSS